VSDIPLTDVTDVADAPVRARVSSGDAAKRAFDVVAATILIVILSPVLLIASLVVALTTPGPILFRQERLGRERRPFTMLKFRTMEDGADDAIHRDFVTRMFRDGDADPTVPLHKLTDDPRVTTVGRFLRRSSLDELPQLLNVLVGDMSLVGPRPALPWEIELFDDRDLVRFDVRPGMTGLWQVSGRSVLTMRRALDLDAEYVDRRSLRLDLSILLRTLPIVVTGRGAS